MRLAHLSLRCFRVLPSLAGRTDLLLVRVTKLSSAVGIANLPLGSFRRLTSFLASKRIADLSLRSFSERSTWHGYRFLRRRPTADATRSPAI